jgi:ribosome-binding protein aMBF1 (putative translation factor)
MKGITMSYGTMEMNGKRFILVPEDEFDVLKKRTSLPEYPPANPSTGNFPAIETGRVGMARKIITRREAVGLSQKALAASARIRVETLNRIERAKVTADTNTIIKIDNALKRAEKVKGR